MANRQVLGAIQEGILHFNITQKENYQARYKLDNSAFLLVNDQSIQSDRVEYVMEVVSSVLNDELIEENHA